MKNILVILTTGFVSWGGLTTVMMNYYREMDRKGLQIDFLSFNEPDKNLLDELHANGSHYFRLSNRKKKLFQYLKELGTIFQNKGYDVVHINGNSATMAFELIVAKNYDIRKRIAHVHNTTTSYPLLNWLLRYVLKHLVTDKLAVSQKSGEYLYGDTDFIVLNNAIKCQKYRFNDEARTIYRKIFSYDENTFLIGTIGKLNQQKNHKFLLRTFAYILKYRPEARLLIIGEGILRKELEKLANILGISRYCNFIGLRTDISELLSAMDVFLFPSLWEGLGLALIEAQASGINCVASDSIPYETKVTENIHYISLHEGEKVWANEILKIKKNNRQNTFLNIVQSIAEHGFNIELECNKLRSIYIKEDANVSPDDTRDTHMLGFAKRFL